MPETQTTPEIAAYNQLMAGIYDQFFFQKLAANGIVPNSQHQREVLLDMGGRLHAQYSQGVAKQASAADQFLDFAVSRLDQLTGVQSSVSADQAYNQAAQQFLATSPAIKQAAVTVAAALRAKS